jgi:Cytochrome b5-like Heme/Steroid binding domain
MLTRSIYSHLYVKRSCNVVRQMALLTLYRQRYCQLDKRRWTTITACLARYLSSFIDKHSGGFQWLEVSRGTDITELFECSHPNPNVDKILAKYFVKKTDIPRNSSYTLESDGFHLTLKRKVDKKIQSLSPELAEAGRKRVIRVHNQILD